MPRFDKITEQWDSPMSARQLKMAQTRYRFALERAEGRDVVEIGCGTGFGLALVARAARSVVGGDLTEANLRAARARTRLPVTALDAHALPFPDRSFDLALLFESIYYLHDPESALRECRRILRPGGSLLLALPNKESPRFHPSPHSVRYFAALELAEVLSNTGFVPEIYGAFPDSFAGPTRGIYRLLVGLALRLHMIPRTLKGRARIKRLLQGRTTPFKGLDPADSGEPLVRLSHNGRAAEYVNLYAVARRDDGGPADD